MKLGTNERLPGIMKVASMRTNRGFLPGKSYFANVKAANEQKNITSTAQQVATMIVFSSEERMSMLASRFEMFVPKLLPNVSFGG
jgi:hypothetical protein